MLELQSIEAYKASVLRVLESQLKEYFGDLKKVSMADIKKKVVEIKKYPNLATLRNPKQGEILVLKEGTTNASEATILSGRFFWEHAAAGEATRLKLGTKYVLKLQEYSSKKIQEMMVQELVEDKGVTTEEAESRFQLEFLNQVMGCEPRELEPLALGTRHMFQMGFDVARLAKKHGIKDALAKQKALVILNEHTAEEIIRDFENNNNFGLIPQNVFYMIQQSFHGVDIQHGRLFFDEQSPKRLHNHGQMLMQKCHENSIFRLRNGDKEFLQYKDYVTILQQMSDMLSFNIEDIGYLTGAIDLQSLEFSLALARQGYEMVMEVVAQSKFKPQSGGACFYDEKLKRVVMVESNRLGGMKNEDIHYLNKNFNHYPSPAKSMQAARQQGLQLPFDVKGEPKQKIYPCPVQGDMNFIAKTAYVMRSVLKPISNLKSPATMPPTVHAMKLQDEQEGFLEFVDKIREGK
jgi:hypothetical protein